MAEDNDLEKGGAQAVEEGQDLDFVKDVLLMCTVEFGNVHMTVRDLLALKKGSVIELNREKGESLAIKANNNAIARGEVIIVNDCYGVRITQIESPEVEVE